MSGFNVIHYYTDSVLVISSSSIKVIFIREIKASVITNEHKGGDYIYDIIIKLGLDHVIFSSERQVYCVLIPQSSDQPITYTIISSMDDNYSGLLKISDNEIMAHDNNNNIKVIALA